MFTRQQRILKAYGRKRSIFMQAKMPEKIIPPPRPMFQPVEMPEWAPQEGVRLITIHKPL